MRDPLGLDLLTPAARRRGLLDRIRAYVAPLLPSEPLLVWPIPLPVLGFAFAFWIAAGAAAWTVAAWVHR